MKSDQAPGMRRPPFFGANVLAATVVLAAFGWGVGFYGPPIYLLAVVDRTGWSASLVSLAVTVHFLAGTIVVANLPRLYRRFGIPAVTATGSAILAAGTLGWAAADHPWQLFGAAALSGIGWVTLGGAAVNALISPWFVKTRPAALGMAYNGASLGGVLFSPLWVFLIAQLGFPRAATAVGAVMVATIAMLAWRVFARTPEQLGQQPDGPALAGATTATIPSCMQPARIGNLWRDARFVTLAAGMSLGLFAQIGLIAHLYAMLAPMLGPQMAGTAMGCATAGAIAGRTLVGWLMPAAADRRAVACAGYAIQAAGSLILLWSGGNPVLVWSGVLLFGSGIGNATSLPPLIAQAEFAREDTPRIVALIVAISQGSYAFAPAVFGLLRVDMADMASLVDTRALPGSAAFFGVAAGVQLAAILSLAAGRRR